MRILLSIIWLWIRKIWSLAVVTKKCALHVQYAYVNCEPLLENRLYAREAAIELKDGG
jgi:hypothetical protein